MPRKAINYSNSCVYKICCNDINITDCYVGSTTNFNKRKKDHKSACYNENNKDYNYNVYKFIRDNGGWDNWTVVLVESYHECKSKKELHKFERYHMEQLEAKLNSQVPGRTPKEYRKNNSEKKKEYDKEYCQNNADKMKEYRKNNSEKKKEYDKEYRQDNVEKIKEKEKKYRQNNAERIKEKVECKFCKSIVQKCSLSRHRKTKKCLATQ